MKKIFLLLIISVIFAAGSSAEVPRVISYSGKLTDKKGKFIDGARDITFKIFNSETGGVPLWTERYEKVSIVKGIVDLPLGSLTPLNLAFDVLYYLEIMIDDNVLSPRYKFTSAAYAINAQTAETAIYAETAQKSKKARAANSLTDPSLYIPKGIIIFCKDSCPAGYRRVSELDGKFLVGGTSYNSSAGGSNQKMLSVENLPFHSHDASHEHKVFVREDGGNQHKSLTTNSLFSKEMSDFINRYEGNSGSAGNGQPFDALSEFATVILCEKQ